MNSKSLYERMLSIDPLKLGCYLTALSIAYISFELTKALLEKILGEAINKDTILYLSIVVEWAKFYIPFLYFRLKSKGAKLKADMFAILGLLLSVMSFSASYLTIDSQIIRLQTEQSSAGELKNRFLKQTELLQQVSVRQVGFNQTTKASDTLKDASKLLEAAAELENGSSNANKGENSSLYKWKWLINVICSLSIELIGFLMAMFICHKSDDENGSSVDKMSVELAERVTETLLRDNPDANIKQFAVIKSKSVAAPQDKRLTKIDSSELPSTKESASESITVSSSLSSLPDNNSTSLSGKGESAVESSIVSQTVGLTESVESVDTFTVDVEKIRAMIVNQQLVPSVRGLKDCLVEGKRVTPELTKIICDPLVDGGFLKHYRRGYQLVKQG